ncbi:hypothetical protein M378DRAFT_524598 [Amanita muscaria Koide BX008]|uniref:Uncharacterized protein n=1 Tax=Amanita muscaria (strain Koide BX008) TaxID=946122 RepID=A0A0C2W5F6_AMAMK|nr:hypothetical protein M378DRAFT_524598 [Amanita muscaria Koide BX008]
MPYIPILGSKADSATRTHSGGYHPLPPKRPHHHPCTIVTLLSTKYSRNRHYARTPLKAWFSTGEDNVLTLGWLPKEYDCMRPTQQSERSP